MSTEQKDSPAKARAGERSQDHRSLYWVLIGPAIAGLLVVARLVMQGSAKLYTEPEKQFYLPDPDLGLRLSPETFHWLGLERSAGVVAVGGFLLVAAFLLLRRERKKSVEMKKSRLALWAISPIPVVIPLIAFLGGMPAEGASATATQDVAGVTRDGFAASLKAPAGTYEVLVHDGTLMSASLAAGGDNFEAKFAKGARGSWVGDPSDLSKSMSGKIFVSAKDVKTGIELRDTHATEYLKVEEFPEIGFHLEKLESTSKGDSANRIVFAGSGMIEIAGKQIPTPVSGRVTELDAAGKKRLGLGDAPALVVNASMSLLISEAPIDSSSFDKSEVPITVSLVLILKK